MAVNDMGVRIQTMRLSRGLSQTELAKNVGASRSTVAMWETGERRPSWDMLDALADAFNVPVSAIVDGENPNEEKELWELREALRRRPEMRTLFSVSKSASKKDIERAIAIIESLKNVD